VNGLSLLVAFGFYTLTNPYDLNYTVLFTALSIIAIMIGPFLSFIQMLPTLFQGYVSFKRISEYVILPPTPDKSHFCTEPRSGSLPGGKDQTRTDKNKIQGTVLASACDASLGWTDEPILRSVSFSLTRGSIAVVTGRAGSGKSTLMKALLGEVNQLSGALEVNTSKIAFCDQTPFFLPHWTVRENVTLGRDFDEELYTSVLRCCRLVEDIGRWPDGDATVIVDTAGSSLSGGQRKRLSLARALYHESELLILDDVFTGIDMKTLGEMRASIFGQDGFLEDRRKNMAILLASSSGTLFSPYCQAFAPILQLKLADKI
jgi:ATP-binding cassette, subfamily C (CFTR/MRP), member 1